MLLFLFLLCRKTIFFLIRVMYIIHQRHLAVNNYNFTLLVLISSNHLNFNYFPTFTISND